MNWGLRRVRVFRALGIGFALGAVASAAILGFREQIGAMMGGEIRGIARVIDGDSIMIDGVNIRLKGIDAPEARQTCKRGQEDWACGAEATRALREILAGRPVACAKSGYDRNARMLAHCRIGRAEDIGARMVRDGWAVSFDATYLTEEGQARGARRGIWAGEFLRPREWRDRQRLRSGE